MVYKFTVYCIR